MNSTIDPDLIAEAYESDPARAAAEYGGEFRSDLQGLVDRAVVEAAVIPGRHELPWVPNTIYKAFADPSGGSSDGFALAISHRENDRVILDCVRERRPPFSPDAICAEFASVLKSYHLFEVQGDRYGGQWPQERLQAHGIAYRVSDRTKSEIYLELLPLLNAGRIELLDNSRLVTQLCGLERRTSRAGKNSVDHAVGSHDDLINAAAGALTSTRGPVDYAASMYELDDEGQTDWSVASLVTDDRGYFHE